MKHIYTTLFLTFCLQAPLQGNGTTIVEKPMDHNARLYFLSLKAAYEQTSGKNDRAEKSYSQLKALEGRSPMLSYALLRLAFSQGYYDKVIERYTKYTFAPQHAKESHCLAAQAYLFLGRTEQCITLLKKLVNEDPADDRLAHYLAIAYCKNHQEDEAIALLDQHLQAAGGSEKAYLFHFIKAKILLGKNKLAPALAEINYSVIKNQNCAKSFLLKSSIEEKLQQYDQAIASIEHYLKLAPQDSSAPATLIQLAIKAGKLELAKKFLLLYPSQTAPYLHSKALLMMASGRQADAEKVVDEVLAKEPKSPTFQDLKITILVAQEKFSLLTKTITTWLIEHPCDKGLIERMMALRKGKMPYSMLKGIMENAAHKAKTWQLYLATGDLVSEHDERTLARDFYEKAIQDPEIAQATAIQTEIRSKITKLFPAAP